MEDRVWGGGVDARVEPEQDGFSGGGVPLYHVRAPCAVGEHEAGGGEWAVVVAEGVAGEEVGSEAEAVVPGGGVAGLVGEAGGAGEEGGEREEAFGPVAGGRGGDGAAGAGGDVAEPGGDAG